MKKQNMVTTKMTTKKAEKKAACSALIKSLVEKDLASLESGPTPSCGGILNC